LSFNVFFLVGVSILLYSLLFSKHNNLSCETTCFALTVSYSVAHCAWKYAQSGIHDVLQLLKHFYVTYVGKAVQVPYCNSFHKNFLLFKSTLYRLTARRRADDIVAAYRRMMPPVLGLRDSVVSVVTRLWNGQLRAFGSISCRDKRLFSTPM
jgi:hypothetical protein